MRRKIQKSMLFIISVTMLLTCVFAIAVSYMQTSKRLKESLKQEAVYIQAAVNTMGMDCLEDMDQAQKKTRVTVVTPDGAVLYDSGKIESTLENHAERKEIQDALRSGSGSQVRRSNTVGTKMYYYAVLLSDGNVLRVAKTTDTIWQNALPFLPYMLAIGITMLIVAFVLAKRHTNRLIQPINMLNLEEPLENEVYEELHPLLVRIDKQNKAKDEAAKMRKEFSANVSHELRTPLTSISGYAEIMKSGLAKPEDMVGFSEKIYKEASRLIGLIEDTIKLSRLDEGSVDLEKEEVDLYTLALEVCERLSSRAEREQVKVDVVGETLMYKGIRRILDEMLYNICENAIKYNKEGGEVEVWVTDTNQGPMITVTDTGIGIPEEEKERIFERFYRVDKSHSKATGGTGLGLSIVKHGAILHQAEIKVESTVGVGTRMEILFAEE